jgi:SH3-like domain-containing protein
MTNRALLRVAALLGALAVVSAACPPLQQAAAQEASKEAKPRREKPPPEPGKGSNSGLPLPRFVSLGSDKVNVRAGPGDRYPIIWQFVRRHVPVEITAEFEYWRRIRDQDGAEGWVHKNLLSGRRYALVTGGIRNFYGEPTREAEVVAQAETGVQGRLLACKGPWCRMDVGGNRGWIPRAQLWGVYADETIE